MRRVQHCVLRCDLCHEVSLGESRCSFKALKQPGISEVTSFSAADAHRQLAVLVANGTNGEFEE